MDDGKLLGLVIVVGIPVVYVAATALVEFVLWRREKNRPYTYGPGLLGLSKDDLGDEEPDRDSCYMCGQPQRGWQPLSLACPECKVRYCHKCRYFLGTSVTEDPPYNTCRYCGFASYKWNELF